MQVGLAAGGASYWETESYRADREQDVRRWAVEQAVKVVGDSTDVGAVLEAAARITAYVTKG